MFAEPQQPQVTVESMSEWLNDVYVHTSIKVNSFQCPTLQSQTNDSSTLHSPYYPNLPLSLSTKREIHKCLAALNDVEDGQFTIIEKSQLAEMESKDRTIAQQKQKLAQHDQLIAKQKEMERKMAEQEKKVAEQNKLIESLEATRKSFSELEQKHGQLQAKLSERDNTIGKLKRVLMTLTVLILLSVFVVKSFHGDKEPSNFKNKQLQNELVDKSQNLSEMESTLNQAQQTIEAMKTEVARKEELFVSSNILVAYTSHRYRMNGSTLTRINSEGWAGCFTKPVSKGIHRLSIKTRAQMVMIGVLDAAEYPKFLTAHVDKSPKAAMMYNLDGQLCSAGKYHAQNMIPQNGQKWSAEADLEKRTLHFFIDGVQQPHHFVNIPVPLVFALDVHTKDGSVEITHWGEEKRSHVTFQGTGHNLG
ncbi:hypothetical protein BLNAU_9773 [Blattamonas nauphoetae]|uniref:Uncharacterized protein n=1 Tax=Blattamonas nauphoetae TaxID=2049346 RepID=A0ABQ9XUS2_9EUKA|nr:hypothetical protein BLNAU_9773 [Blattamonas nauphoetae]